MSIHSLILMAAALGISAPALADPPSWAPAQGRRAKQDREYRHVYYPTQQVYFSPEKQVWFWMSGDTWQVGINLPGQFRVSIADGLQLSLGAERPYVQHAHVEQEYGKPWRERHGNQGS